MGCYDCEYHKGVIRELKAQIETLQDNRTKWFNKAEELINENGQLRRGIIDDKGDNPVLIPRELWEQMESKLDELGNPELAKAAKKATATGSRKDLHEYLKLRRNFI